jgi:hypothetical protein
MAARHLLWHIGIAAAAVVVLPLLFGVAWSTALLVGMMAGCLAMAFGVGHGGHQHGSAGSSRTDTSKTTKE